MTDTDIAIVGSGFSGLGMAIRLKEDGIEDFVVLERGEKVGGTWWVNTYPGCGCDVPSHLYSFSFAPNPDWTRTYSKQPEIEAYLQRCRRAVRRVTARTAAHHRDRRVVGRRRAALDRGDRPGSLRARVLVSAAGALERSQARRTSRASTASGPHLPLRPLGPRLRPRGQAGRRDRHRRLGDPVRARDRAARSSRCTCSSAPRRGSCPTPTARSRASSGACTGASRSSSGSSEAASTPVASCSCSAS